MNGPPPQLYLFSFLVPEVLDCTLDIDISVSYIFNHWSCLFSEKLTVSFLSYPCQCICEDQLLLKNTHKRLTHSTWQPMTFQHDLKKTNDATGLIQ